MRQRMTATWIIGLVCVASVACYAGLFDVSISEQKKLGAQAAQEIESKSIIVGRDVRSSRYYGGRGLDEIVADVGYDLVSVLHSNPWDFSFKVIQNDQVNAFALPGGHIYVFTGLLKSIRLDSSGSQAAFNMLAAVLGHEMTHVIGQHWAKQYKKDARRGAGLSIILGATGANRTVQQMTSVFHYAQSQKYSRSDEYKADAGGINLLNDARRFGFRPEAMVDMLKVLDRASGSTSRGMVWLSDHPSTMDRIKRAEKQVTVLYASDTR